MSIQTVKLLDIMLNPNNPRKNFDQAALEELAVSIKEVGILQPLVVTFSNIDDKGKLWYRLVCGERRWHAAGIAGLEDVPVNYLPDLTPTQEAEIMLVENLQRKDLDPIEEAGAFQSLLQEHGYTQEALAEKLGVSQGHIANRIRLLELPDSVQENISRGIISASHGKVLAGHKNLPAAVIEKVVEAIAKDNIPVAKADTLVLRMVAEKGMPLFDNRRNKPEFKSGKGSACYECEHRALGKDMYVTGDTEQPFCLNPECWEIKQEDARQEAQTTDNEQNVVDISKLSYTQYEYWNKGAEGYDQSECKDCEHRKKAKGRGDQYYCLDPACMKKKKTAKTKADNKQKNNTFQAELGQIAEMVAGRIDQSFIVERDSEVIDRATLIYLAAQVLANVDTWHDRKVTRYQYLKNKFNWDNDLLKSGAYNLLYHDWDTFRQLLETLDGLQLLEVIFEWPAVARGLKGAEEWFLQQVPEVEPEQEPEESSYDAISIVTGRVKRCKDCRNINDRICSTFKFERVSLTSPQHCQYYKLRGDVDIESIPISVEEANQQNESMSEPKEEQGPDPVHELKGRSIKTHYNTGGVVTNVIGPKDDGLYTINYKEPNDKKKGFSIINSITLKDGVILCEGIPLTVLDIDEHETEVQQVTELLPASRYLDKNGRVIFVSTGLGGSEFGTFWKTANGLSKHRVKTQAMPMTPSREEAQGNLDAWAEKNGLQLVESKESEGVA